jgi:CBS domain-containing protein
MSTEEARVGDAMCHGVLTCQAETSLRTVARLMAGHRIHAIVVTDLDGVSERAWGIVTAEDLVRAFGEDLDNLTAQDVASAGLVTVDVEESLERAARLMDEHRVGHLVVVDPGSDRPVGVLSGLDVAAHLAAS